jgi:NAD/NADP transhydrogenase beta subunit
MLMSYAASETYALLNSLVGAAATYVAVKAVDTTIGATNPEFQLTNGYVESFDVVNAALGELQQVEVTFTGGTLVKDVTP